MTTFSSMSDFALPELSYDYDELEPHISAEILKLHHDKHHHAYVDGANKALAGLAEARATSQFDKIAGLERALAFNASGHILHSIYWQNLSPDGGGRPDGDLADAINEGFGTFDRFQKQMNEAAATTMGSGWAALVLEPVSERLLVVQIHDHQSVTIQGAMPLMVLDAWEHAYYLQYRTDKAKYFDAIWNLWNWEDIAARHAVAKDVDLLLGDASTRPTVPDSLPSGDASSLPAD